MYSADSANADERFKYWNYTFVDIGKYDVPAVVSFIVDRTNQ